MISSRYWRIGVRAVTLPRSSRLGRLEVAKTFVVHGIEHILFGYDRLLFVLALMLIARNWRALLLTVTAFTAAHSITLTLATLGLSMCRGRLSKRRSLSAFCCLPAKLSASTTAIRV
ncbi:HupE/UreJ family protein [Phyllobacterium sp. 1468]|uniref:HupE/UreJ family protein n=1 Tax=Phyllobacterium sp. 1468 TaxID=2817759 RepID=UPI00286A2B53|nr:HupE/UreJ family protein [Phyllobacterium sp. 1468]